MTNAAPAHPTSWPTIARPTFPIPTAASDRRRVVVTGLGIVAPTGIGKEALWEVLVGNGCAIRPLTRFDASGYPVQIAAEVPDLDVGQLPIGRLAAMALFASRLAVEDAGTPASLVASPRTGFYFGTAAGPVDLWEAQHSLFTQDGLRSVRPTFPVLGSPHAAAAHCATALGVVGPLATVSSDCPSGLEAVATAFQQLQAGVVDVAFAGGADAPLTPMLYGAFGRSGMLAPTGCRPFDAGRSGFVLGEGSAVLVLEDAEHAVARGARIYGEILGSGTGRDRIMPLGRTDPSGQGYVAACRQALAAADLRAEDLDHVNAHAPGIGATDLAEAQALHTLLGARARFVPVTSIKGALGHPLAAAAVLQIATVLLSFAYGLIPPTYNCEDPDPACNLHVVRGAPYAARLGTALVESHGFGGNSTALVLGAAGDLLS
jgi:3-oxoacyl-[acyl-carrier-protein] synthase II